MNKKWLISIVGALLLLTFFLVLGTESTKTYIQSVLNQKQNPIAQSKISLDAAALQNKNTATVVQNISDDSFKSWILSEVKNIEVPVDDLKTVEERTKDFVSRLSEKQLSVLADKVLNFELPINERIFANYALTIFTGTGANQILYSLAIARLPDFGDTSAHTAGEVKRAQEYALRYMEIDRLSERAIGPEPLNLEALQMLSQIAQNTNDLKIQNYAKRKLAEIQH